LLSQMELYGSVTGPSFEDPDRTLRYAQAAQEVLDPRVAADPNDFNARIGLAGVYGRRATALYRLQKSGAVEEARRTVQLWKELRASERLTAQDAFQLAWELRALPPVLASRDKQEGLAVAREIVDEHRRIFAGLPAADGNNLYVALALATMGSAALSAGDRAGSQHAFDEAIAKARPLMSVPSAAVVVAFENADFAHLARIDRLDRGACVEAREWWNREVEIWRTLAPKSEYAAMRLHRAQNDPPSCQTRL